MITDTLDAFVLQYIETALWSSTDDDGTPLDGAYSIDDVAPEAIEAMQADCIRFQLENAELIKNALANDPGLDLTDIAHDFWLTRNHHGAGFWDGDYAPESLGEALTEASHAFGEAYLYIGDDGQIYVA